MSQLGWQKSSFSSGGEGNCIELAAATPPRIHLRESARPSEITTAAPRALAHLLHTVKGGTLSR
ncbi:DUF397 domain-containing protein [Streptomyces europaeiscabiei]|uniref:DUF397 domain-containing protein n=1 Tax=Streptomyces europaeiscabiei TaxID=146819 RepID=A0ABU4NAH1_9ACTN|nr:DUF397 domain-containing protein [Streptomyces europaeiscabiei]MDX2526747.1 DUF397 domain-containing protein [Streptomyces europaeiscabiei]MDX2764688.1 DUF397 domain-containing protein [Streptomyces europaeiscabiei]MDX3541488.1 DUF397 domain-containing protein [Streptomyces europaeiscabiei]MDX3551829.1 DUF397 domain-containing protein [Streptomyces europaeiscabiei]MDX3700068.1 DUF397 domain-containing protein [Streptomyces europaeiscabiei]